uniref:Retrovirus-related Pol polyprotein from transposon TNT 1-94 n=1 Tax=Tanacetum cinerariifolium TaxID=118510 RepID=A0A6L2MKJ9_TANCI|nr:retrovirus-related Pol polyprotein from transposon TNT 1-94 [Tanacetum cinerariifolium]
MQEELLQFKMQKVWVLVDLPKGKRVIGSKWVFRNKKDEKEIMIRNKARLVAQGHTQTKGINYDEVFAPVVKVEAIWLFLAYASFIGFMVYQMDVKSAFLYETIEEEVYVCQPLGFEDLDYPHKVYKVVKALYGLHQALRAWKFDFTYVKSASTPIEIEKPLLKDPNGEDVDVHIYRPLITAVSYELMMFGLTKDATVKLMLLGFDQVVYFLNVHVIRYALMVNPTIYVSCIKQFWALENIKKYVSAKRTAWNEFSCSMASAVICLASVIINQVDNLTSYTIRYTSYALTQKAAKEEEEVEVPNAPAPPSPTPAPSPPPQDPTPTPYASPPLPTQEQPTETSASSMTLFNSLLETCATLSQKVAELEQDKHTQAWEIIKLKKRVKKLEKKKRSKYSGLKRLRNVVDMDVELQGRVDDDNAATKDVNATEPTVFDDEEVTMTMAQTLIKMKAKKAKLLDEQIAKRLHDEEVEQAAARDKPKKDDLERAQVLQKKYQILKRKPVSIAQARKNMIIYLKNMAGYKMEHFKGMTYDKVRPIFEREYNKVQTLFKPDKNIEESQKKRVAEETLLQESFKKLKAVEVSGFDSTQETPTNDPKEISEKDVQNMLEIVIVSEFKVEALQVKYPIIDWEIHSEGSRTYWKIIRVSGITCEVLTL